MKKLLPHPRSWPARWRYAGGAFLLGVTYSLSALLLGVESTFRGVDVTMWVGLVVEVSFAVFGYLLGLNAEARRRERRDAGIIEEQLRDLAAARTRLGQAEKLASLGEMAGAIVHEVRNPLAIIRSMTQNLEEGLRDEHGAEAASVDACRQIRDEIDRLARVTASLSAFSRKPTLRPSRIDVASLAHRTRLLASELLTSRNVELRLEPPAGNDGVIDADEDLLAQVLLGLLENAAAASPAGGVVCLAWRRRDGRQELTVSDEGAGVPEELRQRIFDPFFTTRADGHGLGLAVARQIVHAHGGTLDVVDGEETGATFRIRLPLGSPAESREVAA